MQRVRYRISMQIVIQAIFVPFRENISHLQQAADDAKRLSASCLHLIF